MGDNVINTKDGPSLEDEANSPLSSDQYQGEKMFQQLELQLCSNSNDPNIIMVQQKSTMNKSPPLSPQTNAQPTETSILQPAMVPEKIGDNPI